MLKTDWSNSCREPLLNGGIAWSACSPSDKEAYYVFKPRPDAEALAAGFDVIEKIEECLEIPLRIADREALQKLAANFSVGHRRASDQKMITLIEGQIQKAESQVSMLEACVGNSLGSNDKNYGCPWLSRKISGMFGEQVHVTVSDAESGHNELIIVPDEGRFVVRPLCEECEQTAGAIRVPRLWPELERKFGIAECIPNVMINSLDTSPLADRRFDFIFGRHLHPGMERLIEPSSISRLLTEKGKAAFSVDQVEYYSMITITSNGDLHVEEVSYAQSDLDEAQLTRF